MYRGPNGRWAIAAWVLVCVAVHGVARGRDAQPPELKSVFPPGGQAGTTIEVQATISGSAASTLVSNVPGWQCVALGEGRYAITVPAGTTAGLYDVWAVGEQGVSSPRTFYVGHRAEVSEPPSNDALEAAPLIGVGVTINGRLEKAGDRDCYRFDAKRGQLVLIECWAERIDSPLRAVLEIYSATGIRLAVNRGYFGVDPLIPFQVPEDGTYTVRVEDLVASGSNEHCYRLDIATDPRVVTWMPAIIPRGQSSRITLFGWNLGGESDSLLAVATLGDGTAAAGFERLEVEIPAEAAEPSDSLPVRLGPAQSVCEAMAYRHPGSHQTLAIGLTDVPVSTDTHDNHSPASAQIISCPGEISGQLAALGEQDWFALDLRRGEVVYFEAFGERIDSPVDLDLSIFDAQGQTRLAHFSDELTNVGGKNLPTTHLDPSGRWVAPHDGTYLICIRDLAASQPYDPRRVYQLAVRREQPDFQLLVCTHAGEPRGLNIPPGGRATLDVLALRQRGCEGSIRVTAVDLPEGVECPDVWLGPGVSRTTLVVSASENASHGLYELRLKGLLEDANTSDVSSRGMNSMVRRVNPATVVRANAPMGWGRLMSRLPLYIGGNAPLRIRANGHEPLAHHLYGTLHVRHAPGSVLDIAVTVDRDDSVAAAEIQLTGIGLPPMIQNQAATIAAGEARGHLSFYLPPTMPAGTYSLAVRAHTTLLGADGKKTPVYVDSNTITFEVSRAAFYVEIDPLAPRRARRGETLQVAYRVQRMNGFIGKVHTELAAPGVVTDVDGLLARGETFVGQTDSGSLQIIVNPDAPLGPHPFLRLFTVGVVEDEPIYFGSQFLPLEIVE